MELDESWKLNYGPRIDSTVGKTKLYTLAAYFLASGQIASQCHQEEDIWHTTSFNLMLQELQKPAITQLLIECAVMVRMKDDLFEQHHGCRADAKGDIVGTLMSPSGGPPVPLDLREACNKIIHAKGLQFDVHDDGQLDHRTDPHHLLPRIYLYGSLGKINWKAELDILKFVDCGYTMFP
jgi:hypothetical protein